jgi:hypothetical protein
MARRIKQIRLGQRVRRYRQYQRQQYVPNQSHNSSMYDIVSQPQNIDKSTLGRQPGYGRRTVEYLKKGFSLRK